MCSLLLQNGHLIQQSRQRHGGKNTSLLIDTHLRLSLFSTAFNEGGDKSSLPLLIQRINMRCNLELNTLTVSTGNYSLGKNKLCLTHNLLDKYINLMKITSSFVGLKNMTLVLSQPLTDDIHGIVRISQCMVVWCDTGCPEGQPISC